MSRPLEFIASLITRIGTSSSSINSLRVKNSPSSQRDEQIVSIEFDFLKGQIDQNVVNVVLAFGLYTDDYLVFHAQDLVSVMAADIRNFDWNIKASKIVIHFSKENHVLLNKIIEKLKQETIYGLPISLYLSSSVSQLKIYYGSNQVPVDFYNRFAGSVMSHNGHPVIMVESESSTVDFHYLSVSGQLRSRRANVSDYLDAAIRLNLRRFALNPRSGISVYSLCPESWMQASPPFGDYEALSTKVRTRTVEAINRHTTEQLRRLNQRIQSVNIRRKVSINGAALGVEPVNEIETVLLYERLRSVPGFNFPNGLSAKILSYSPEGIDVIGELRVADGTPSVIAAIEFEFRLRSFFEHGHDYRQVSLIICYTVDDLVFPYEYGGISYTLDRSAPLPKLRNSSDDIAVPCLILKDLVDVQ